MCGGYLTYTMSLEQDTSTLEEADWFEFSTTESVYQLNNFYSDTEPEHSEYFYFLKFKQRFPIG